MATTSGVNFSGLQVDDQAIDTIAKLTFKEVFVDSPFAKLVTVLTGQRNGDRVGKIGPLGELGVTDAGGCNPVWTKTEAKTFEQVWSINRYKVTEQMCADDLDGTIAQWARNTGNDRDDLTNTKYMTMIIKPLFADALLRMYWRLAWFGDESATNITDGGSITDGVDVELFKVCDGLWKRLFAIGTANADRRITIAANAELTYALQKSKIRESGVATKIMDDVILGATPVLRQRTDGVIVITQSLADALALDIRNNNGGSELQFKAFAGGMKMTTYSGMTVITVPEFDSKIAAFNNTGTAFVSPHRAVYTTLKNLQVATEDSKAFAVFSTWYDRDSFNQKIVSKGTLGTMIAESDLVQLAY